MPILSPSINFNGNAEEAFRFYQSVFGGEFSSLVRLKDLSIPGQPAPAGAGAEKILHIALPVGPTTLIGNDVPEGMGPVNERENRSKISIAAESRAEADRLYNGLSAGGEVEMPIGDAPWGAYFAMFRDKYGIEWMVSYSGRG